MSNCQYCSRPLPNNKAVAYRCSNCGTVWCANGNCTGSSGRPQHSRAQASMCQTCQKAGYIMKV